MSCIFFKIVAKEIPSQAVYEDDNVYAFEDLSPQAPVHILIVPKKHISTSLDIEEKDNSLIGQMYQAANKIAREKGVAEDGFRMVMNCNKGAGQTVFHIHLHMLAGRPLSWPPG